MKVVLLESLGVDAATLATLEAPFTEKGVVFSHCERTADIPTLKEELDVAEVAFLADMPLPAEAFENASRLQYINVAFTGVNHVAVSAAKERGIVVSNASGYATHAVSELTLGTVLSLYRELSTMEKDLRGGGARNGRVGLEVCGKTVGVIGCGKIGSQSAELFYHLGATILGFSHRENLMVPHYVEPVSLEDLLARSDIVLLHCPLNENTHHLIDEKALRMMKPNGILVNMARGPVVDNGALAVALKEGRIAGAALDVFDQEPPLNVEDPILSAPNTLLTPHIGFATKEAMERRAEIVFDNLAKWMEGTPQNLVY